MERDVWVDWVTKSSFIEPIVRLAQEYGGMMMVIRVASFILGTLIIVWTITSFLKRKAESAGRMMGDNGAGTRLAWGLIGGSLMIQLAGTLSAFSGSVWGTSTLPDAMQYGNQAAGSAGDPIMAGLYAALGMLVVIGWVIGLRSCYQLSQVGDKVGHGDGTSQFWSAFTSLIFSSALINIMWVADVLAKTFTDSTFSTQLGL